jgi:monoamine oxidase
VSLSRRKLIHLVGKAGGVGAAYRTMAAMGMLPVSEAYAGPPALPPGEGRKIVVVGAGIAGLVLAYELAQAGFDPIVLEARPRPGGRNWSLRAGDEVIESDSTQRVHFNIAEHLYFNPGPARIPYHHEGILSYCRMLKVPLEVLCNDNRGALMQDDAAFEGKPQLNRRVANDARGYVAELASKAADAAMSQPVSPEDKERLRDFLRAFGALDKDMAYRGSTRSGWAEAPGGGDQRGKANPPLDLRGILASDFWEGPIQFGELGNMAATMLQPVGGMGRIGQAFGRKLWGRIIYRAQVTALRRTDTGARVIWRDEQTSAEQTTEAPLVVVTIPLSVLRGIAADFAPATRAAITAADYVPAGKVAFQAERRFWELDDRIYGGISWTSRDITQIWYPTAGIHQAKGVLVGAYIWSQKLGNAFAAKNPQQRLTDALADGEALHPGASRWLARGVAVAWKKVPYSAGAWAEWSSPARIAHYPVLLKGDGPFLFAGEHMSWINGWQEGAVQSAHQTLADIAARLRK